MRTPIDSFQTAFVVKSIPGGDPELNEIKLAWKDGKSRRRVNERRDSPRGRVGSPPGRWGAATRLLRLA